MGRAIWLTTQSCSLKSSNPSFRITLGLESSGAVRPEICDVMVALA